MGKEKGKKYWSQEILNSFSGVKMAQINISIKLIHSKFASKQLDVATPPLIFLSIQIILALRIMLNLIMMEKRKRKNQII